MKSRKALGVASAAAMVTLLLAGCAPGASGTGNATTAKASTTVESGKYTIQVASTPESGAPLAKIITKFEKKYPNVTVKVQKTTFDDYNKGIALALNSSNSPDIAYLGQIGNLPKDHLIIPLNKYEKLYNWDSKISSNVLAQWQVSSDYKSLGGNTLYGTPTSLQVVGVYYNKSLTSAAGITSTPTSLAEYEQDLQKVKASGALPIQLGNSQGHAAFTVQEIGQSIDGAATANKWALGKSGADFNTAGNRKGAQTLVDWVKDGYAGTPTTINGTDLQGSVTNFTSGKGAFLVDGNWDAGTIDKAMGKNVGFFTMPGAKATAIGGSTAYGISARSKHPNASAAFINFLISDAAAPDQFAAGFLPINVKSVSPTTPLETNIVSAYSKVDADNGIVSFNNNVTASMNDTLIDETQQLIAGRTNVSGFISGVQADWKSAH